MRPCPRLLCRAAGNSPRLFSLLLWLAILAATPGCSQGPQFAEVEGKVTLDGQPLPDVEVIFLPDPGTGTLGSSSSCYTDENGHYELRTHKGQSGAVIGTHRVCIRDLTTLPLPPMWDADDEAPQARPRAAKSAPKPSRVPLSYKSSEKTPLRAVEVKAGEQTLDFQLGSNNKK